MKIYHDNGHKRRYDRANWWYQNMREVVDKAIDWQPEPKTLTNAPALTVDASKAIKPTTGEE